MVSKWIEKIHIFYLLYGMFWCLSHDIYVCIMNLEIGILPITVQYILISIYMLQVTHTDCLQNRHTWVL